MLFEPKSREEIMQIFNCAINLKETAAAESLVALVNSIFSSKSQIVATLFVASCSAYGAISTQFQSQDGHGGYSYGYR